MSEIKVIAEDAEESVTYVVEQEAERNRPGTIPLTASSKDLRARVLEASQPGRAEASKVVASSMLGIPAVVFSYYYALNSSPLAAIPGALLLAFIVRDLHRSERLRCAEGALNLNATEASALPCLIDMLVWPNDRISSIVRYKLDELLPRFSPTVLPPLGEPQRRTLHKVLLGRYSLETRRVALKVLETYGDEESMELIAEIMGRRRRSVRAWKFRREAELSYLRIREAARLRREAEAMIARGETRPDLVESERLAIAHERSQQATEHLAKLEDEAQHHKRPALRTGFLIADWFVIVPYTALQALEALANSRLVEAAIWTAACTAGVQLHRLTLSVTQSAEARKLAALSDIRSVGTFAEALGWPDPELKNLAEKRLADMLPLLKASDVGLLNAYQRQCLNAALKLGEARRHSRLIIAVLKAWEQVGDPEAIPFVERLVAGRATTREEKDVVAAAQECLPSLREAALMNRQNLQLLRASSVSETTHDLLVRPALDLNASNPDELLRSSEVEPTTR